MGTGAKKNKAELEAAEKDIEQFISDEERAARQKSGAMLDSKVASTSGRLTKMTDRKVFDDFLAKFQKMAAESCNFSRT